MFGIFKNNIITEKEKDILLEWTYENEHKFIQNEMGSHRKYYKFTHESGVPRLFFDVKKRILKRENIKSWTEEPMYMDYIGWMSEGGFIQRHKDAEYHSSIGLLRHVRYNLFLSVPYKGGDPVYNERKLRMKEMNYVRCNSGSEYHRCEPVEGNKPRIVISYGVLIK